jgi:rubrerythrin
MMKHLLLPVHRWIWRDDEQRAHRLLRFGATEADGGRDLVRAAELTADPVLRRLYLFHAGDEYRHAEMFRTRGEALLNSLKSRRPGEAGGDWLRPVAHGLDDLSVGEATDASLLAFLHLSEKNAAISFSTYRDVLAHDPPTRAIFEEILEDESYHMNYTLAQLARVSPRRKGWLLWRARFARLWRGYLRLATALADRMSAVILTALYFILLPPFAVLAKRAEAKDPSGWSPVSPARGGSIGRQY